MFVFSDRVTAHRLISSFKEVTLPLYKCKKRKFITPVNGILTHRKQEK